MAAEPAVRHRRLALAAMLFAVAMTFIDQTIVAIASPDIQRHLGLSRSGLQWGVNAYLLALAAAFPLAGRLADVYGRRRMVVIGIVGFAVSSGLCGAAPTGSASAAWLIIFRVTQGLFAAIMVPAAVAIVVAGYPQERRGRAMALFFGVSGALTSIGPIAGGYLTRWTWRSVFWINVPVAIVALVLTAAAQVSASSRRERIDFTGGLMAAIGMGVSVLGFQQAQTWGWDSPATWACIVVGLGILAIFIVYERGIDSPVIRIAVFSDRRFAIDNVVLLLASAAFVPLFFFASTYAQDALGYSSSKAGLYLLVIFAGFAPAAQIGGRLLDRRGVKRPVVVGAALATAGFACWAGAADELGLSHQWIWIAMCGAGLGLIIGPASTDAVNRALDASYGEVTGITQTVRNYGAAFGFAVLGTVFSRAVSHVNGHESTADIMAKGMHYVLWGMAFALGLCFLVAIRYPRQELAESGAVASLPDVQLQQR